MNIVPSNSITLPCIAYLLPYSYCRNVKSSWFLQQPIRNSVKWVRTAFVFLVLKLPSQFGVSSRHLHAALCTPCNLRAWHPAFPVPPKFSRSANPN